MPSLASIFFILFSLTSPMTTTGTTFSPTNVLMLMRYYSSKKFTRYTGLAWRVKRSGTSMVYTDYILLPFGNQLTQTWGCVLFVLIERVPLLLGILHTVYITLSLRALAFIYFGRLADNALLCPFPYQCLLGV